IYQPFTLLTFSHVRRGSAIAKIVGTNARNNSKFDSTDNMWVFEETVNGRKLTDIINTDHENVKYLPGHKLPENVVRNFSADILLFVIPLQFIGRVCDTMKGKINPDLAMTLHVVDEGPDRLKLISEVIHEKLGIKMSVWMGANITNEVLMRLMKSNKNMSNNIHDNTQNKSANKTELNDFFQCINTLAIRFSVFQSLEELEKETLNSQKLQPSTHLNILSSSRFPLFNAHQ
uniref:Glycerol-3-phosphate dehydrogenase 1a n=1 Tax=Cyprinus carpio TaxID=7962 RepID=A0A8C2FLG6_CYPCA